MLLGRFNLTLLESLEIECDRGQRRLELVRDCVNEGVVLLVSAYFPDEKGHVQGQPSDQHGKADDADQQEESGPPVHHNPPDVQRDRDGNQD